MAWLDLLITGGTVVDGSGAPGVLADVGVRSDRIRRDRRPVGGARLSGIEDVIVNGRPAILSGSETGERPGRLLRRA